MQYWHGKQLLAIVSVTGSHSPSRSIYPHLQNRIKFLIFEAVAAAAAAAAYFSSSSSAHFLSNC